MSSSAKPCAYCGERPRAAGFGPFCSAGCQDRDLLKWLDEAYVVPAGSNADELRGDTDGDAGMSGLDSRG